MEVLVIIGSGCVAPDGLNANNRQQPQVIIFLMLCGVCIVHLQGVAGVEHWQEYCICHNQNMLHVLVVAGAMCW